MKAALRKVTSSCFTSRPFEGITLLLWEMISSSMYNIKIAKSTGEVYRNEEIHGLPQRRTHVAHSGIQLISDYYGFLIILQTLASKYRYPYAHSSAT
jgi:hypothetical protein